MEDKLKKLLVGMTADEAADFETSLDEFADSAEISEEETQRILALTMRKAGNEMENTIQTSTAIKTNKRKWSKRFLIFGIAAAAIVGLAAATGAVDRVQQHFSGGDLSPYSAEVLGTMCEVSNDDITLTVNGVVPDVNGTVISVSVTSHSKKGEEIVGELNYVNGKMSEELMDLGMKYGDTDMTEDEYIQLLKDEGLYEHDLNSLQLRNGERATDQHVFTWREYEEYPNTPEGIQEREAHALYSSLTTANFERDKSDTDFFENYFVIDPFVMENQIDLSQPLIVAETVSGLSLEIDLTPYIDTRRLTAENGFEDVTISSYTLMVKAGENDFAKGLYLKDGMLDENDISTATIHYKDGHTEDLQTLMSYSRSVENGDDEEFDRETAFNDPSTIDSQELEAHPNGEQPFDLDSIDYIVIDGIEYRYAE